MRATVVLFPFLLAPPLAAQKMPVSGDAGRIVQVFDVRSALDLLGERPARSVVRRGGGGDREAMRRRHRAELVDAIQRFVEPPLGDGDAVTGLGPDRMVALVRPEQAAWIERFLDGVQKADHEQRLSARFTMFRLAPDRRAEVFDREDLGVAFALEVDRATMRRIRRAGEEWHSGPTSARPLHPWRGEFGQGMPCVATWRKVRLRTRDDDLVAPILEAVFDGIELEIRHVPLPGDRIGHVLTADVQTVDWETPAGTVRVGEQDYATDLPVRAQARFDDAVATTERAPFVFGRRLGDQLVLVTFEPRRR